MCKKLRRALTSSHNSRTPLRHTVSHNVAIEARYGILQRYGTGKVVGSTSRSKRNQSRKRGTVIRKNNAGTKWLVRVGTGGRQGRRYLSKLVKGTRLDAEQERAQMAREIEAKTFSAPNKQTLSEYVNRWLDEVGSLRVAPHTLVSYRQMMATHVLSHIGARRLDALTSSEIQTAYARMTAAGSSPRLVRYTHTVLKMALKHAVAQRVIVRNPADHVTLPKQAAARAGSLAGLCVLTGPQVKRLVDATANVPLGPLWNLLLHSGLRPQEAFALQWTDLTGSKIAIGKALVNDGHGGVTVGCTKTKSSRRTLTLPPTTLLALKEHRRAQAAAMLEAGSDYRRGDLMFANRVGGYLDIAKVRKVWKDTLDSLGMPKLRLYDTRHTHATLMLLAGVHVKAVSARLGHATVAITLDTYARWLPEMDESAADALEQYVQRTA